MSPPGNISVIAQVAFPPLTGAIGGVTVESLWQEPVRIEPRWRATPRPVRGVWR
jgi:hypothetical protein